MLEEDYPKLFARLRESVEWQIELPSTLSDFFERSGYSTANRFDVRRCPRIRSRHKAILFITDPLPAIPRSPEPVGIYSADLSRTGFGCLCRDQLFPGEEARILLPNCWMEVIIARGRRLGPRCWEAGALLKAVHMPQNGGAAVPQYAGMSSPV